MKKIDIKGKDYITVNERVKELKGNVKYEGWRIISTMVDYNSQYCIFKAEIVNANGEIVSVGHAKEDHDNGFINATSSVENCETSAVGRALGFVGIGIDTSIATADEVANAIINQDRSKPKKEKEKSLLDKISFGKHKGKSWKELIDTELGYVQWVINNSREKGYEFVMDSEMENYLNKKMGTSDLGFEEDIPF